MSGNGRRPRRPYPSQRYGSAHKVTRRRLAPLVESGTVRCARCHEVIVPGETWQLDHKDDGHGWLGASHERCNGRAGWEKMVEQNGGGGQLEERPYRWSRRWHEEPPVGTEVVLGGCLAEVHVGGGVWQTLNAST